MRDYNTIISEVTAMAHILHELKRGYDNGDPVINDGEYQAICDVLGEKPKRTCGMHGWIDFVGASAPRIDNLRVIDDEGVEVARIGINALEDA